MKFRLHFYIILFLTCFAQTQVMAEEVVEDPLAIIQTATSDMIKQLNLNKSKIQDDQTIVMGIVDELLLPHFATNTIARKVLGKHVRQISDEQQEKFTEAFRFYMVRFYSKAFAAYTNQTFEYKESPEYEDSKRVTIKTLLIQSGSQPIPIDYLMQRSGNSWKIIDLKIEGISMVISNRTQFGNQISRDGIDTVIAKLEYKNKIAQTDE